MPARDVLHCILPPYILEKLANCDNAVVRDHALSNIAASAECRGVRMMTAAATPVFAAMAAPTAKKHRLIYDMKGKPPTPFMLPGKLVRSEGEKKGDDDAVNEAYDYTGHTYDFYKRVLGRNSLDDNGMKLISSVHAGKGFNNALWNGTQMIYGDGDTIIFGRFTQSLDIVGHELTHGVVTFTCDLEYQDEPGALNEHFADVFGSLIKQWRNKETAKQANWLIGEDIVIKAETRKALRSMAKPGDAFQNDPYLGNDPQPAHMDKKYKGSADYSGVHLNSGIPNHAFYLVATGLGGRAWEKAGKIWYDALLQLNRKSDFQECARITHQVAGDHGANTQQVVKEAWKAVGLSV